MAKTEGNLALKPIIKSEYELRTEQAIDHIEALHTGDDGFITVFKKFRNNTHFSRHYKIEELKEKIISKEINLDVNTYISVNSFYIPKRGAEYVRQFRSFFLDIDNHDKEKMSDFDYNSLLYNLREDYFDKKIPNPSIVVKTGRGIQLYFLMENAPKRFVSTWTTLENLIIEEMKNFDVLGYKIDTNAKDVSRVLRLAGSLHTQANKIAEIDYDESDFKTNTISEIFQNYFPQYITEEERVENNPQGTPYGCKKEIVRKVNNNTKKTTNIHYNYFSLNRVRLNDLNNLYKMRNGFFPNMRNKFLLLYSYFSLLCNENKENVLEKMIKLNKDFKNKDDKIVNSQLKAILNTASTNAKKWNETKVKTSDESNNYYVFKTKTIIDWLNITTEEQKQMQNLFGIDEKKERIKDRNKRFYKKLKDSKPDEDSKQQKMKVENIKIKELREKGCKNTEIAKKMGLSLATIKRRISKI